MAFDRWLAGKTAWILLLLGCICLAAQAETQTLAGRWRFQLDPSESGAQEHWFGRSLSKSIRLPGALQNEGFGDDITLDTKWTSDPRYDRWKTMPQYASYRQPGHIEIPFMLQPEKHYVGPAWYQRDIEVPDAWQGRRVVLTLERPHWITSVWLDQSFIGTNDSLGTAHVYDLGANLKAGRHTLTIRVDNRLLINVGAMAHSVTDHSQGNWNGIIGKIELTAGDPVWIDGLQAYPNIDAKTVRVTGQIRNDSGKSGSGRVDFSVTGKEVSVFGSTPISWDQSGGTFETTLSLGPRAPLWDEFEPALLRLAAHLENSRETNFVSFGLRQIGTSGREFILNHHPIFFRGTLECCVFPLTGYPPTDLDSWRRIVGICKDYGLNHIRFHSWCPPEAAFEAADESGFYFQIECGVFGRVGDGAPVDDWIYRESERIVQDYGNHPSFMLFTHGNEPHGTNREAFLQKWVDFWKERDSRRLVTTGTAFPILPESQYHVFHGPRGAADRFGRNPGTNFASLTAPVIIHEMGQWCAYPDFDDIKRINGPLKPYNFEIIRDSLREHGMFGQWRDFLKASGHLQVLCYKEEIESALTTPGIGGFQLLDLHDFPGQGTALVGVLDSLWESKGYVTPSEFREFCSSTIPVARLPKRTWTTDETLKADLWTVNFGAAAWTNAVVSWKLLDKHNRAVAQGEFAPQTWPLGQNKLHEKLEMELKSLPAPAQYKLTVKAGEGASCDNGWNIWVYPAAQPETLRSNVLITSALTEEALDRLQAGGKVVWATDRLSSNNPALHFQPVFWNRYMFNTHALQTLGLLIDTKHPALASFPTESFQDWQWNDIVSQARGINMDGWPVKLHPIVQVIDDWNTNRRLGLIFECRVGKGKLLACSADLEKDLDNRPAAAQLRRSLLAYVETDAFNPKVPVSAAQLKSALNGMGQTE